MERKTNVEKSGARAPTYEVKGVVIHGNQLWRELGFPTANIFIDWENSKNLENIVSVCEVLFDGVSFPAVGTYLPFKHMYEVHLLDREGDLYGKEITVVLLETIRENKKFETQQALIQQIAKDVEVAKNRWIIAKMMKKNKDRVVEEEEEIEEVIGI